MFWIAVLGLSMSWALTKFGALSATVGILTLAIKLLLIAFIVSFIAAVFFWLRKKISQPSDSH